MKMFRSLSCIALMAIAAMSCSMAVASPYEAAAVAGLSKATQTHAQREVAPAQAVTMAVASERADVTPATDDQRMCAATESLPTNTSTFTTGIRAEGQGSTTGIVGSRQGENAFVELT